MKLTGRQVLQLYTLVEQLKNVKLGVRTALKLATIRKKLQPHYETIEEVRTKLQDIIRDYETERLQLCHQYAVKDKDGNPVIAGTQFVIEPAKLEEFNQKIQELREKYKDALDEFEKEMTEFEKVLDEEIDIDIPTLKESDLPPNLELSIEEVEVLSTIIED